MNLALSKPMSSDEFLAWEREQELRWEFDGFQPVAMNGGTIAHGALTMNVAAALGIRLRGKPCRPYSQNVKVKIGASYRYPDAFVSCLPSANNDDVAGAPVVVLEVVSKSTERTDRITKLREYRSIETLRHYVLIEQDQVMLTTYTRAQNVWVVDQLTADDTLRLPEIGIEIPVTELYGDLTLPELKD